MTISSTQFPNRNIHKVTWISPDGETNIQIDYVVIDKRAASSIMDVKARRGTNIGSDLQTVQVRFRCKITVCEKGNISRTWKPD